MTRPRAATAAGLLAASLVFAACSSKTPGTSASSPDNHETPGASSSSASSATGSVTVFAAASLNKTFTEIGKQLEASHPRLSIRFSFAGSSDLVAQLISGAPADVLATADQKTMTKAQNAQLLTGTPTTFATNHLVIATAPGNPQHITSLKDLTRSGLKVVICAQQVPCGAATQKVTTAAGITLHPVSEENAVTDVLGKVTSGQADAGLVYTTDAKGAGDKVTAVTFPEASKVTNVYPITVLQGASNASGAQLFVSTVLSADGQKILQDAGFGGPNG